MGTLAFFPWFTAAAPVAIGRYQLVPHRVGASLEAEPRLIDALLAAHLEPGGGPVESATLIQLAGRPLTAELGPADEAGVHALAVAVAFALLARRTFFDAGPYLNAEHLRLVLRRFTGSDPRTLQIVARRRDGHRWVAHGIGGFRTTRPPHAPRPPPCEVDAAVASAVVAASGSPLGTALQEAIAAFLAGSGDADGTSSAEELFFLAVALERLTEVHGAAVPDAGLAPRLVALLAPFVAGARTPRRLSTLRRLEAAAEPDRPPSTSPSSSIVEAWAKDLVRARGAPGAGPRSYWPPRAHLLLGAHLFPLVVLVQLAAGGLRPLSDAERTALLAFPYLTGLRDPFARRRSLAAPNPHLWRRALEVAGRARARLQLAEILERTRRGAR